MDTSDGSNITPALASTTTDSVNGSFVLRFPTESGPVRVVASGGSYSSEMNSATISSPATVSLVLASGDLDVVGLSVNPLSTFVDSRTVAMVAAGGTNFLTAFGIATARIEQIYGLGSEPGTLQPDYGHSGSDASNLGLILGAIINEDQKLCATPGGLVTALSSDISDGVFDGLDSNGNAVTYCGGTLPAIAGTSDFQDALSGLNQLQNISGAFAFGGTGNLLTTTTGIADIAINGSHAYPLAPLATINGAIPAAAPSSVDTFAAAASTATMTTARYNMTGTLLPNGKVLIAGGANDSHSTLASTDLYDPATNTFAGSTPTMNDGREEHTAVLLPNGKVLLAGGETASGAASTELYDPVSNTFAPPGSTVRMNVARLNPCSVLLPNGLVLIAAGTGSSNRSTELYNPATNTFAAAAGTALMNVSHGTQGATCTLLPNGKVLIAGGTTATKATDLYDPATNTFAASGSTASMNSTRTFATTTLLPNGKVLIAGGIVSGASSSSAELYDPATNTFAASTPSMNQARDSAAAILLPNGKVLIAGGEAAVRLESTELYDPVSNSFGPLVETVFMNQSRAGIVGVLLTNGKVLLPGGVGPPALSSTDLYTP